MKIKETVTDEDLDFAYSALIITTFVMLIEGIIWRIFVI